MAEVNAVETEQDQEPVEQEAEEILDLDEPEVEAEDEESEAGDEGEFKFDKEKAQKQNREIGNLKRQLKAQAERDAKRDAEIEELKKNLSSKAESKSETRERESVKDEAADLLDSVKNLADDDYISVKQYKEFIAKLSTVIRKANQGGNVDALQKEIDTLKSKLEKVDNYTETSSAVTKAAEAWDEAYEPLAGQYKKFSSKAFKLAREQLGDDADAKAVSGLATGYLNALARKAMKAIKDEPVKTKDKTSTNKPATSTKGTANVKKGAVPEPSLDDVPTMDLRKMVLESIRQEEKASVSTS